MIIWIIGKSGSGKTYFAKKIFNYYQNKKKIFWIDGDEFRKFITYNLGYDYKSRMQNSKKIIDFCRYLESKKYIVICSILSIFKEHQKLNRKIFKKYYQIYLKAEQKILEIRNKKKIYSKIKNIVSKDIEFPEPYKSDLIITNNFKNGQKIFQIILKKLNTKLL